jgi:hypothetical protein
LSGFAQLSFSHKPSSLRSSLKTFGLPSESVFVRHVIRDTVHLVRVAQKTGLYFMRDRESTDASHQVFSFLLTDMRILSAKPWPGGLSIRMSRKGLEKP